MQNRFNRRLGGLVAAILFASAAVLTTSACGEKAQANQDAGAVAAPPAVQAPAAPAKGDPAATPAAKAESAATAATDPVDLPDYVPVKGVSGSLKSVGSDTMNNLMAFWAEGFKGFYPNVKIEIEGKGSGTAPPALVAGTASFGPMSRPMKDAENDEFEKKYGYKPTALPTSIDMLAVYVHKDNPIKGLTLAQVDAIFSKTRKLGNPSDIRTWGDVGLDAETWARQPISLYGRNSVSGTYSYFKEHTLGKGDFKDSVKEQAGSAAVVQSVASDLKGIGYSGIGYKTADVRAVPLARDAQSPYVTAEPANAYSGEYPMSRFLLLTVNKEPNAPLDPLRAEFVKYVFSRQGQEDVKKDGYFPVTRKIAEKALRSVGLEFSKETSSR